MPSNKVSALALAIAMSFPGRAIGLDADFQRAAEPASQQPPDKRQTDSPPALGAGVTAAALIAAGLAAAAALASAGGRGSGGDGGVTDAAPGGGGSTGSGGGSGTSTPPRTLSYTSAADFQTSEYGAQQGLGVVKAESLYFNGHYRWYVGDASHPAAGTGIGVKIAVADTGINVREASTGSAIAIDVAASYDYMSNRAGSGADAFGHGTHVAGIIAAPKNGAGMHGLAYNASVVNFKVGNATITASDGQLADMMSRAANAGAMIINNSWGTPASITSFSRDQLQASMPRWIEASREYVAKGGVVVFAAGND